MTTYDQPRDCPDWFCQPARCVCGAEWEPECSHLTTPPNIERGSE